MKKLPLIIAASAICAVSTMAAASPILMMAKLSTAQASVTHKLLPASDAMKAPHPFYKKYCKGKSAESYRNAMGLALLQYYPNKNLVKFAISYQGVSGQAIMAHFHIGQMGVMGPIVQTICGNPPPGNKALGFSAGPAISGKYCPKGNSGFITGSFKLKANKKVPAANTLMKVKDALMTGQIYINFHTCLNEPGEIRGQIRRWQP
jgi:hypothetical protein